MHKVHTYRGLSFEADPAMGRRMRTNNYEIQEIRMLNQIPNLASMKVLELGGCLGVVSCILNRRLKRPDMHLVAEANPNLIPTLRRNRNLNNCQFRVANNIILPNSEEKVMRFYSYNKPVAGSAHRRVAKKETGRTEHYIPILTLDKITSRQGHGFDLFVIDIEGGELDFFNRLRPEQAPEWIMVEKHEFMMTKGYNGRCQKRLKELGYTQTEKNQHTFLYHKQF